MRRSIGMIGLIVVAMMLAMTPTVSAFATTWCGNVTYPTNDTWVPDGWTIYMENVNVSYPTEPWNDDTHKYMKFNGHCDGELTGDDDWLYVNVTSPDGRWYGEFTNRSGDMPVWYGKYLQDITVYEQEQPSETFTKDLSPGWNLISLPLTPIDSSTDAVLGNDTIAYNAVYRYDATSKEFECPSTMDPGIGYFVYVTTAGIWEYEGTPVSSTSLGLKSGLNMIGVPNCTMGVSDAMGPTADYRYVARWNAVDQKFEVYTPSAPVAFHHFDTMEAGEGYFVSAKTDDSAFAISCP